MHAHKFTNQLIHEQSPYLLQHAHNPVNWLPWGQAAWDKAKNENKLMLVSIGYSSCHWCHVMEHESFEDEATAQLMNQYFVCIKVDREERPDVDMVYMSAVQLMTGRGGWPLNCFTLPDGRPVYGGTYFHQHQWQNVLTQLGEMYKKDEQKFHTYAQELTDGMAKTEIISNSSDSSGKEIIDVTISNWKKHFDKMEGGTTHAPKFPLPNNYLFLLRYGHLSGDAEVTEFVKLTLNKMTRGGIYDQVGGGFARYSTDMLWKAPHFEKMLYDNAQLLSLYSEAFRAYKDPLYEQTAESILSFLNREMRDASGLYHSALDADSEGEEGKFYVWTVNELSEIDFSTEDINISKEKCRDIVFDYFSVNAHGLWEHGNYILLRQFADDEIAAKHQVDPHQLEKIIMQARQKLLHKRNQRIRPMLDDKCITSWNALMISGLCHAFTAFDKVEYLNAAISNANFILNNLFAEDEQLLHCYKNDKATVPGFLEDYSHLTMAFMDLYQCTFNEQWLMQAQRLADHVFNNFTNGNSPLFYFTSKNGEPLVVRQTEVQDNVIPSSNSTFANALLLLAKLTGNMQYAQHANNMLNHVTGSMAAYGSAYSNWLILLLNNTFHFYEVVLTGKNTQQNKQLILQTYRPNTILAGAESSSTLPVFEQRFVKDKSWIYLCEGNSCKLPVENVSDLNFG